MSREEFYNRLHLDTSLVSDLGFNPYYLQIQSSLADPIQVAGKECINLAANNYLGLADDPRVKEAMIAAVNRYGASLCGTPIASGYADLLCSLEKKLAAFIRLEAAAIFPSCFQANTGLFSTIANRDDLVVVDHYAHSSLVQGIKSAGCKIRPFLHNNLNALEKILQRSHAYRQIFVVTESVFSTTGNIAPLSDILVLCRKYNAIAIIDDSHGIGVLGKSGRGILEEQGIDDFPGIYTASLGKSLANSGGIIAGRKDLLDYLRYYCPHLVYSTALVPAVLGGISRVIDIITGEFEVLADKMWRNKAKLAEGLSQCGYQLAGGQAPITSIVTGGAADTLRLAGELYKKGVFSTPFIEPSVPPQQGVVRLIAGANLEEDSIAKALAVFQEIRREQRR
ncbi:MAG: pyridoxal phosphate-dependent aminotransferase family protein [Proteobacteria bacterium]|nr:pyridoxal phosphate-dependent aminotransferase family protein [Pseudomonadota bacterium]MBU1689068.1 pyridoxal phosphate-dependent aminotransferase family protein [Pseudomonadota bacterium]